MELAIVPHDAPDGGLHYVVSGKGSRFPMSEGLGSGYPGAPNAYIRIKDCSDSAGAPQSIAEIGAETEQVDWGVYPLMQKDALYVRWNGGGGYGDPLERPAELVRRDVDSGLVSSGAAEAIYGVLIQGPEAALDKDATDTRRKRMRGTRRAGVATV